MMKLLKKSLVIPTCLTLLTASSQAALILEFNEIGGTQVELSFIGSVTIAGSFHDDAVDGSNILATIEFAGYGFDRGGSGSNFQSQDGHIGDDLLSGPLVVGGRIHSVGPSIGLLISNGVVLVGSGLDGRVADNDVGDVDVLDAGVGGNLNGKTQTFNTTFAASGLDRFLGNGPQDLWRVSGTTGDNNLIQFRVNASSVPEPSSILMSGLGLLSLLTRRKRKA